VRQQEEEVEVEEVVSSGRESVLHTGHQSYLSSLLLCVIFDVIRHGGPTDPVEGG